MYQKKQKNKQTNKTNNQNKQSIHLTMNNRVVRSNGEYHYLGINYVVREVEDLLHTTNEFVDAVNGGPSRRVGELINQLIINALHLADNYDRIRVLSTTQPLSQSHAQSNTQSYTQSNRQSQAQSHAQSDTQSPSQSNTQSPFIPNFSVAPLNQVVAEVPTYQPQSPPPAYHTLFQEEERVEEPVEVDQHDESIQFLEEIFVNDVDEEDEDEDEDDVAREIILPMPRQTARKRTCYIEHRLPTAKRPRLQ